jgi:hypothetical protein
MPLHEDIRLYGPPLCLLLERAKTEEAVDVLTLALWGVDLNAVFEAREARYVESPEDSPLPGPVVTYSIVSTPLSWLCYQRRNTGSDISCMQRCVKLLIEKGGCLGL